MKTIFFTISRGSLIRNFFQSGIITKILDNDIKVVVLTPQYDEKEIFVKYAHKNLFFEPLIMDKPSRVDAILAEFSRGVIYSKTVLTYYKYRIASRSPSKVLYYPRIIFFFFFRFFPGIKTIIRAIGFRFYPQKEHDHLFEKYDPDLVFITDYAEIADIGVLKSAKRYKVKTAGLIKSWDNLSKFLFRMKTDRIFTWGEFCKRYAIKYQCYKKNEISVVGVPQFDYYKKDNILDRGSFCKKFGFDSNKKIIFYGSTGSPCDYEAEYVDLILEFLKKEKLDHQILIRPHIGYVDDHKKFEKYKDQKGVAIDRGKQNLSLRDNWDISDDHLKYLYNSIYHSDVSINIASTLTFDSIAIGTPVINIFFDSKKRELNDSVTRFYKTNYISEVAKFNGAWIADSKENYFKALKEILVDKKTKKENVEKMIKYFLHKNDNHTGDRLVAGIIGILNDN